MSIDKWSTVRVNGRIYLTIDGDEALTPAQAIELGNELRAMACDLIECRKAGACEHRLCCMVSP